jgi:uncharacterized protein YprB with RNaseH-like and TPR domain
LVLESFVPLPFQPPGEEESRARLLSALGLVHGIGPFREMLLRKRGYSTLLDLAVHPRFGREAAFWSEVINRKELFTLYQGLCRWYSPSHPLVLALVGLAFPDHLVFIDLESLGLSTLPIFLIAVGKAEGTAGVIRIRQFLARNLAEEAVILAEALEEIPGDPVVASYNGKAHDWRQWRARLAYYELPDLPQAAHLDFLFFARRLWRAAVGDCSLTKVERAILGRVRPLDIPSEEVPLYYHAFLKSGNPQFLWPILAHNREDVVSLVALLGKLLDSHA